MRVEDTLLPFLIGERIGSGAHRDVYEFLADPTKVLKVARKEAGIAGIQANINEFEITELSNFGGCYEYLKAWIAPATYISGDGVYMLQERTEPITHDQLPEKVPAWATDLKLDNCGMLGKLVVLHDYGLHLAVANAVASKRTKKANW